MSKTKTIEKEVKIISIKDIGKLDSKKKSEKDTEEPKTIQEHAVVFQLTDDKIKYNYSITGEKKNHPLDYLITPNDIGLKAILTLKIGPNPQKTLDETS